MIKLEIFLQITEDNLKRSLKNNRALVFKLRKYLNLLIFRCNVLLLKEKISNNAGVYYICNAFLNITRFFYFLFYFFFNGDRCTLFVSELNNFFCVCETRSNNKLCM